MVGIVERRFNNAIQQEIYLFTAASTPGQNYLKVQFFGPVSAERDSPSRLKVERITDVTLYHERRKELPGVALRPSPYFLQNNYGPFGYAVGGGRGNDTCLYGWQQIQSSEARRSAFENQGVIQVRLRLCEAGATEEKLLSVMYNFTITGSFQAARWNPYGDPPPADRRLGVTGQPIYPPLESAVEKPVRNKDDGISVRPRDNEGHRADDDPILRSPRVTDDGLVPSPTGLTADTSGVIVPSPVCSSTGENTTGC